MEYREIVAVTGVPGLFQLLATKSDGAIVRNLADKSTKFISARMHNVTPLESIEIYTTGDNVRLHEIFEQMKEKEAATPLAGAKSTNDDIKNYFLAIYPEIDADRVYVSDMKKILKWYDVLKGNDMLNFESMKQQEVEGEDTETEDAANAAEVTDGNTTEAAETNEADETGDKPAKKARAKKSADTDAAAENEDKPKKVAKKKKTEGEEDAAEGEEAPAKKAAKKKKTEE